MSIPHAPLRVFETHHAPGGSLAVHRHGRPYLAVVLEGAYVESSVDGAWECRPGDVVVHPAWHLHADAFALGPCRVLNLEGPLDVAAVLTARCSVWRSAALRASIRGGRLGAARVVAALADAEPLPPRPLEGRLAALVDALAQPRRGGVAASAARLGMSREHASRSLRHRLGLPPRAVAGEARFRRALALLLEPGLPLAEVALEAGFADQSHLTRVLSAATGLSPRRLRRALLGAAGVTSVQEPGAGPG